MQKNDEEPSQRMNSMAVRLMVKVEEQMSIYDSNQSSNTVNQNQINKKKRGRPKKVIRDPSALHYRCRHNKSLINCFLTFPHVHQ